MSQRKRKRENRRRLAHKQMAFKPRNGYVSQFNIWDEVWQDGFKKHLAALGFDEMEIMHLRDIQGPDVIINPDPVQPYHWPDIHIDVELKDPVAWRRANPILGEVVKEEPDATRGVDAD